MEWDLGPRVVRTLGITGTQTRVMSASLADFALDQSADECLCIHQCIDVHGRRVHAQSRARILGLDAWTSHPTSSYKLSFNAAGALAISTNLGLYGRIHSHP